MLCCLHPHLRLRAERRNNIKDTHVGATLPFDRRKPFVAGIESLRHEIIDERPDRDTNRLFTLIEDAKLLQQDSGHHQPFEIAERNGFVAWALGHQPYDFAEHLRYSLRCELY